jgi:hypothetical protein
MSKISRSPAEVCRNIPENKKMMIDPLKLPAKCPGPNTLGTIA